MVWFKLIMTSPVFSLILDCLFSGLFSCFCFLMTRFFSYFRTSFLSELWYMLFCEYATSGLALLTKLREAQRKRKKKHDHMMCFKVMNTDSSWSIYAVFIICNVWLKQHPVSEIEWMKYSLWNLDVSWLSLCSFSHGCAQRGVVLIAAHDSRVAALAFSPAGDKIATASEKVCLALVLFLISTATMCVCVCFGGGGGPENSMASNGWGF